MNTVFRTGALALALLAGTALTAAPAMASHDHWGKKSWSKSYKHHGYAHRGYGYGWKKKSYGYRSYSRYGSYGYRSPRYGYGWPYYYRGGPGFSIRIY